MSIEQGYFLDPNWGEELEIKDITDIQQELDNLKWEIAPRTGWIKKIASAMLAVAMLSAQTPKIDTSTLPHYAWLDDWVKKHVKVKVTRVKPKSYGDYTDVYTTDYYEKYNPKARKLETSYFRPRGDLKIRGGEVIYFWKKYKLLSVRKIDLDDKFLKKENLDSIVININWERFVTKPHFLLLRFWRRWGGFVRYEEWRSLILVYVPYFDWQFNRIEVLWAIESNQFFEENNHISYDISDRYRYITEFKVLSQLFKCGIKNCKIKRDREWNKYFYKNWRLVWKVENFGDEKIVIKKEHWKEKVVAKIIQKGKKEIIINSNNEILAEISPYKPLKIKLKQLDVTLDLLIYPN